MSDGQLTCMVCGEPVRSVEAIHRPQEVWSGLQYVTTLEPPPVYINQPCGHTGGARAIIVEG